MSPGDLQVRSVGACDQVGVVLGFWTEGMEPAERLAVLTAVHAYLAGEIVGVAMEAGGRAADAALVRKAALANQAFLDVIVDGVK